MTPEAFQAAWDGPRVVLPQHIPPTGVPADAMDFLRRAGLPRGLSYGKKDWPGQLSFECIERGLVPVLNEQPANGPRWPANLSQHYVLGEESYEGGSSPFWCIHGPSGRVEVVDLEASGESVVELVNTSVMHLAATLVVLREWVELRGQHGSRHVDELRAALRRADPEASDKNRWASFIAWIASAESEIVFRVW